MELLDAGETSLREGDYKEAIRALSKAFELSDNRSTRALLGIGTAHLRLSKSDRAREFGERILELGETEVEQAAAENLIGSALLRKALDTQSEIKRLETLAEAESHLRASLDSWSGEMSIAWFNLSVALQEQDRLAEARDAQQEYVNRTPKSRPAKVRLCRLQYLAQSTSENPPRSTTNQVDQPVAEQQAPVTGSSAPEESESRENPAQTPLKVGRVILPPVPPVKMSTPSPQYTAAAREKKVEGVVIIEAIIGKTGSVTHVKVLKGLPLGLNKAAAIAVCEWQFEPATLNGEPVAVIYNLTVNFRLQ